MCVNRLNNRSRLNGNNNIGNDNNRVVGIAQLPAELIFMGYVRDLWLELCSYDNLFLAYKRARKHKTQKPYVIEFENNLEDNLLKLRTELLLHCYEPKPLVNFIIRDPKTRKISKSDFRDRIVHHALCNIIEPIFDRCFICDSYANRIGKGSLNAIKRFDHFKRKVSRNNTVKCYILKADIKKYFESVDHEILLSIIRKRVKDKRVLWLIRKILANSVNKNTGKGMPLGNLTSQFFANVYLNELDWFVKSKLKARYYIRYVDDFVILEKDAKKLEFYRSAVNEFLVENLKIELHPDKSKISCLGNNINFLGFRVFYYHKLLKKSNIWKMRQKFGLLKQKYDSRETGYDAIHDFLEGWFAYAQNANTYKLRRKIMENIGRVFPNEISTKEINRYLKKLSVRYARGSAP